MVARFRDRTAAGKELAEALKQREAQPDVVLAIPRGGLPLGRVVADVLDAKLDIVVAKKIGAPDNPEYAIGAVASDGTVWRNEQAMAGVDDAYFEQTRQQTAEDARRTEDRYRRDRPAAEISGSMIVVVDDGVATGATVRACLQMLNNADPKRIVLAVPVGPPDSIRELEAMVDDVLCLDTPTGFRGVGQFYERFDQVTDEEAISLLET